MRTQKPSLEITIQPEAIWDLIYTVTESAIVPPLLMKQNRKRISRYKKFLKQPKRRHTPPNIIFSSTGLEVSGFLLGSITDFDKRCYIIERAIPSVSANRADDWVESNYQSKLLINHLNRHANQERKIIGNFHSHPEVDKSPNFVERHGLNHPSEADLISSKYDRTIDLIITIGSTENRCRSYRLNENSYQIACFSYMGFYYWICGHKNRTTIPVSIPSII